MTSRPTIRRAMGATIRTEGKATSQLDNHAFNQMLDKTAPAPRAEMVETPEMSPDMISDRKKPKAMGA